MLRNILGNVCLHQAAAVTTSVNHDRYTMSSPVLDVEHGRLNAHAINDLVGLNYAGWRRWRWVCGWRRARRWRRNLPRSWGLRFREIANPYQGCKKNGMLHFYPFQLTLFSLFSVNQKKPLCQFRVESGTHPDESP
jgi:hypothetical protein